MADQLTGRRFAAFDIDGTIIRWQLYHAIAEELARAGCLGAIEYETVRKARMQWKHRQSSDAFQTYEQTLINVVDAALTGIRVEELQAACQRVIVEYKDQVYTFTRELIKELKANGYLLFAVSASQNEIVELLAEYYGFDDFGGSIYATKDGYYTGHKALLKRDRKPEYLKELAAKHNAIWDGSIAVGDSDSDIAMLASVEQPIAFNPSKELFEHASSVGWRIVIERKNMVYDLRKSDGTYVLA